MDHLEHERGNTIRTRNARLAAIRSLFGYAALRHPEHAATIQRVLAIPSRKAPISGAARSSMSRSLSSPISARIVAARCGVAITEEADISARTSAPV